MAPFTKLRESYEPRWVSWYMAKYYTQYQHAINVPLGRPPQKWVEDYGEQMALRRYRPSRPVVDAIVYLPRTLILIEAKILNVLDGITKLVYYAEQVPLTPELEAQKNYFIDLHFLCVHPTQPLRDYAEKHSITIVTEAPDWVEEYYQRRNNAWTRDSLAKREERKKVLGALGYR